MNKLMGGWVALVCCFWFSGCAYAPLRQTPLARAVLPPEMVEYYRYPESVVKATVELKRSRGRFNEYLVRFPLRTPPDFEPTEPMVEIEWMESKQPGKRPAIVFNPILGGNYPLERNVARFLASNGFHVALIHRKTVKVSPEHPISQLEILLRQGVFRIRQVVDWMVAQERVDANRIGSFGISMGGMASIIAAATEPRFSAHVAALPGGSIPDVLMSSRDSLLAKPVKRFLERNEIDRETLERQMRESIRTDPLLLAPYVDPEEIFLIIALLDRTIGTANGLRLRRALDKPKTQFIVSGHYTAYLYLPFIRYVGLRFLKEKLDAR